MSLVHTIYPEMARKHISLIIQKQVHDKFKKQNKKITTLPPQDTLVRKKLSVQQWPVAATRALGGFRGLLFRLAPIALRKWWGGIIGGGGVGGGGGIGVVIVPRGGELPIVQSINVHVDVLRCIPEAPAGGVCRPCSGGGLWSRAIEDLECMYPMCVVYRKLSTVRALKCKISFYVKKKVSMHTYVRQIMNYLKTLIQYNIFLKCHPLCGS